MDEKKAAKPVAAPLPDDDEMHPEYPGLTKGRVRKAQARAREKADKARLDAMLERIEDEEYDRLSAIEIGADNGVFGKPIPADILRRNRQPASLNDIVEVVLDMPNVAFDPKHNAKMKPWIQIDGRRVYGGETITTYRHMVPGLMHVAQQMRFNEAARKGDDRFSFYQNERAPLISKKGGIQEGRGIRLAEALSNG